MYKIILTIILYSFQYCVGQNIVKKETTETYKGLNKFGKIEKGELTFKSTIYYDKKGNAISYLSKSENPYDTYLNVKETTKFNIANHPVERNLYNLDGSLIEKTIFKYDKNGNEIEYILYKSDGSLNTKWTFIYNDKGQKTEHFRFDSDGIQKNVFYYDSKGNIELEKRYQDEILFNYSKNSYDDKGYVIKIETYNVDDSLISTESMKYDLNGNIIENITDSSINDKIFKYSYTYSQFNKFGKWTKKISYLNDEIDNIEIRKYEYF
ncbi:hypothetical protein [Flavobacterium sp.]|uniref:hypothetical protein n=1 Tax=Flavobacterium sp. TaxID=239 RepID=UPI001B432609|nr:hypothetical protein [Flavobacterium sp.]MBP6127273.1 hypothetical protein [Flavobacterium sp.]